MCCCGWIFVGAVLQVGTHGVGDRGHPVSCEPGFRFRGLFPKPKKNKKQKENEHRHFFIKHRLPLTAPHVLACSACEGKSSQERLRQRLFPAARVCKRLALLRRVVVVVVVMAVSEQDWIWDIARAPPAPPPPIHRARAHTHTLHTVPWQ